MKRVYGFIGLVLWVIFVDLIAPDLSHGISLLAAIVGYVAIWLIAIEVSGFVNARSQEVKKQQD